MKKLVLEVLNTKWGKLLRVKEQTHRGGGFGMKGNCVFTATNGFDIASGDIPEITEDCLYIRGSDWGEDHRIMFIPSDEWLAKCRVAVREYNEYFADKKTEVKQEDDVEVIE